MKKKNVALWDLLPTFANPQTNSLNTHFHFKSVWHCSFSKHKTVRRYILSYIVHVKPIKENMFGSLSCICVKMKKKKCCFLGFVSNFCKSPNKFIEHSLLLLVCFTLIVLATQNS